MVADRSVWPRKINTHRNVKHTEVAPSHFLFEALIGSSASFVRVLVLPQSACDGVLQIHSSVLSGMEGIHHRVTSLRTVLRAITHSTSAHRRSAGTVCNLAHAALTVLLVLKFSHFSQDRLATKALTCGQSEQTVAGENLSQAIIRTKMIADFTVAVFFFLKKNRIN